MNTKKTHQEFIAEMAGKHPDIEVLGQYVNAHAKIAVKHSCGYIWEVRPSNLLMGQRCPNCAGKRKLTHQEFLDRMLEYPDIEVLDQYVNSYTKINVKHLCGYIWDTKPSNLLLGHSCPECFGSSRKLTHQEFLDRMLEYPDIEVLDQYVNSYTKINVKHSCGHIWKSLPSNLLVGYGCPQCGGCKKLSPQEFVEKIYKVNPEMKILGQYVNSKTKIKVKHSCGHIWNVCPNNLLNGQGCPGCTKFGFQDRHAATFYVYEIIKDKETYFGFGISNIYSVREKRHLKNLSASGANIVNKWLYQFESGYDCKGLEADLKATVKAAGLKHNLGIEGFLTECAKEEARSLIMQHINKTVCQTIHTTS